MGHYLVAAAGAGVATFALVSSAGAEESVETARPQLVAETTGAHGGAHLTALGGVGIALMSVGTVSFTASIVTWALHNSKVNAAVEDLQNSRRIAEHPNEELADLQRANIATFVIGACATAAGVPMLAVDLLRDREHELTVALAPGGASLRVRF